MHDTPSAATGHSADPATAPLSCADTSDRPLHRRPVAWFVSMAMLLLVGVTGVAVVVGAMAYLAEQDARGKLRVVQLQLAAAEKQRVQLQSELANEKQRIAESKMVVAYLRETLSAASRPTNPADATILAALRRATEKLDRDGFPEHPTVEIEVRDAIARGYDALGEFDAAEAQYAKVLEQRRSSLGKSNPAALATANRLRKVLLAKGGRARADELRDALNESFAALKAESVPGRVPRLYGVAQGMAEGGQLASAVPQYRRALRVLHNQYPDGHPHIAEGLQRLAPALMANGDEDEAIATATEALEMIEAIVPEDHADVATGLAVLGTTLVQAGRFEEAESRLRRCLNIRRAVLEEGHWLRPNTESLLGEALMHLKRYDDAEKLLIPACAALRVHPDAPNDRRRQARQRIVSLYEAWGRPEAADPFRQKEDQAVTDSAPAYEPPVSRQFGG